MRLAQASLLDVDSELSTLIADTRLAGARADLSVKVMRLPVGVWDTTWLADAARSHLGLLVIDGAIARDIVLQDAVTTELLGPGDIVRPWEHDETPTLVGHAVQWTALDESRIALLDESFGVRLGRYPEVATLLFERVIARSRRLAVERAIAGLNRVDRRVLALFWHLAERWGRVTSEGVAVPLTLSHHMVGQLISARRPTVSIAVAGLRQTGELVRRDDGTWLLTGDPPDVPPEAIERVLPRRRQFHRPAEPGRIVSVEREDAFDRR